MKSKVIFIIFTMLFAIGTIIIVINLKMNSLFDSEKNEILIENKKFSEQWGLYNEGQVICNIKGKKRVDINILKAWNLTKGSSKVIVGMLDSGFDINCDELKSSLYYNYKEIEGNSIDDDFNGFVDDINGWNFYDNTNSVFDSYLHDYHGTFLGGIIAASHNEGKVCGIAPNVKLLPLKFIRGSEGQTEDAIKAIEYADLLGVKIINCSWDSNSYDKNLFETMKKYKDILFICSAGKNANDLKDVPVYPACFDLQNVVSVAAIDSQGYLYEYSGYGADADVAAPGVNLYSTMPDGDYTFSSGTSEATAYVSGVAALVKSYNLDLNANEIADILKNSTRHLDTLKNKVKSEGIIDAYKCLKNAKND